MLGKLLKQEFYATSRYFLPMYLIVLVLSPVYSLLMKILDFGDGTSFLHSLFQLMILGIFGFALLIFSIFVATLVMVIVRFYKTTATSEAYLTFTLPVPTYQIILAKTIASVVWYIVAFIVMSVSITSMFWITEISSPMDTLERLTDFTGSVFHMDTFDFFLMFLTLLSTFTGAIASILEIFTAIAIGQLFRNHRVLISIGIYFGIIMTLQFISAFFYLFASIIMPDGTALEDGYILFTNVLSILKNIIISASGFTLTTWIMKRHLNVC